MRQLQPSSTGRGARITRRKELFFAFLVPIMTIVIALLLAEMVLRFLPVYSGLRTVPVDASQPLFHATPNRPFVFSAYWNMRRVVHGRVNNAGFMNDQDYRKDDALPLVAVVGDSYIEAQMVPYAETGHGRLASAYAGKLRVYSFSGGGAPLSQYLVWAQYAVREYGARALVVNVVGNDFDESLLSYKIGRGYWHYVADNGSLQLRLAEYHPNWLVYLLRQSALMRYVTFNLGARELFYSAAQLVNMVFGQPTPSQDYAGNTSANTAPERVRDSLAVIDAFFRDFPMMVGLAPDNVLFTIDGFRYPEAAEQGHGSYFDLMRRAMIAKAEALGYEVIDLDKLFLPRHRATGERFEFEDDAHWNGHGHAVLAEAIASSRLLARLRQ
jgi:hypothetical protein